MTVTAPPQTTLQMCHKLTNIFSNIQIRELHDLVSPVPVSGSYLLQIAIEYPLQHNTHHHSNFCQLHGATTICHIIMTTLFAKPGLSLGSIPILQAISLTDINSFTPTTKQLTSDLTLKLYKNWMGLLDNVNPSSSALLCFVTSTNISCKNWTNSTLKTTSSTIGLVTPSATRITPVNAFFIRLPDNSIRVIQPQ